MEAATFTKLLLPMFFDAIQREREREEWNTT